MDSAGDGTAGSRPWGRRKSSPVLRLRDFATERDAKVPRWLGLTRRGILYDFAVAADDEAYVRFGVNLSPVDAERDELISLRFAAASATMSAVPLARIVILPDGDVSIHVDGLVASPDHLGRCVDDWAVAIGDALDLFDSAVVEFAEPAKKREATASKKAGPRPVTAATAAVFRLKVKLRDVRPPVGRRLEVPGNVTFLRSCTASSRPRWAGRIHTSTSSSWASGISVFPTTSSGMMSRTRRGFASKTS